MNYGKIIASVGIVLNVSASIGYLCVADYRRAIYWMAAAILTASVTY